MSYYLTNIWNCNDKSFLNLFLDISFYTAAERCLSFRYHMFGHTVDTLNVLVSGKDLAQSVAWTQSGNQGSDWKYGQVTIQKMEELKVIIAYSGHMIRNVVVCKSVNKETKLSNKHFLKLPFTQ